MPALDPDGIIDVDSEEEPNQTSTITSNTIDGIMVEDVHDGDLDDDLYNDYED